MSCCPRQDKIHYSLHSVELVEVDLSTCGTGEVGHWESEAAGVEGEEGHPGNEAMVEGEVEEGRPLGIWAVVEEEVGLGYWVMLQLQFRAVLQECKSPQCQQRSDEMRRTRTLD